MGRWRLTVGVVIVALSLLAEPALAGVEGRWSKRFTVTSRCGCTGAPLVASSARYGTTVAWVNSSPTPAGDDTASIWARRIRRDGSLGPKRKLGDVAPYSGRAAIAAGASGAIVLVWHSSDGIRARRISPRGQIGRLHRIFEGDGSDLEPGVAVDARGNAVIAWSGVWSISSQHSSPPVPPNVHVRRLSAQGERGPIIGLPQGDAPHDEARVSVAPSGRAMVAWHVPGAIRAAAVETDGAVGPVLQVNPEPVYGGADLATDRRGTTTFIWQSSFPEKVNVRQVTADGQLGPVHVPAPGGFQGGGRVALDRARNALATWSARPGGGVTEPSLAQLWLLSADGTMGSVVTLSPPGLTTPLSGDGAPLSTIDRAGDATLAWGRMRVINGRALFSTLTRRLAADGTLGPVQTLVHESGALSVAAIAVDGRNTVTATWNTGAADVSGITAARFTPRR